MTTIEINLLAGAGSAAAALPEKVAETAAENTNVTVVQPTTDVGVAEDRVADNVTEHLGIYLSGDNTEKLPNWAVLTALRAYGMNLKPQAEQPRPASVRAQPVAVTAKTPVAVEAPAVPAKPLAKAKAVVPAATHVVTKV